MYVTLWHDECFYYKLHTKKRRRKHLMGMQGFFGADFDLSKKGKYGMISKFQLKDGKVCQSKFWHTVK